MMSPTLETPGPRHPDSAARLARVGVALFGPLWQTEMARALNLKKRTVQRWAAGENPVRADMWMRLYEVGTIRRRALAAAMRELRQL